MAIRADDVGFRVRRAADVGSGEILRVAAQARVGHLRRSHLRKCGDCVFSASGRHMSFARTVTTFATRLIGRRIPGRDRLVVRVHIDVAQSALVAADEVVDRLRRLCKTALRHCQQVRKTA